METTSPTPKKDQWTAQRQNEGSKIYLLQQNGITKFRSLLSYSENHPKEIEIESQQMITAVNMHKKLVTALRVLYTAYMREDVLENVSNGEKNIQYEIEQLLKEAEQK